MPFSSYLVISDRSSGTASMKRAPSVKRKKQTSPRAPRKS